MTSINIYQQIAEEKDQLIKVHEDTKREVEEDADFEIEDLKDKYDAKLASEREVVAKAEQAARSARVEFEDRERERDAQNARIVELLTSVARSEDRVAGLEDRVAVLDAKLRSADEGLEVGQMVPVENRRREGYDLAGVAGN